MASRTVNKVVLLGHLGGDGDTRYTANGVARTTFSLATNRYWKDADGQAHEEAEWHNAVLWRAENLTPYLIKGKQVYVDGRLKTRSWEDQDGNRRYTTEVIAEEVILLGGGSIGNGNETKPQPPEQAGSARSESGRAASAPGRRSSPSSGAGRSAATGRSGNPPDERGADAAGVTDDDVPFEAGLRGR